MARSAALFIAAVVFIVLSAGPAVSDSVYLKNGNVIECEITKETEGSVTVKELFGSGEIVSTYNKADIERIERSEVKPAAEKKVEAQAAAAPAKRPAKGLGLTYEQVIWGLDSYFPMKQGRSVGGKPRYVGESSNGMAVLEIIGDKANITKANLALGTSVDYQTVFQNTEILKKFCENTAPEVSDFSDWVSAIMSRQTDGTQVAGNKLLSVVFRRDMNVGIISVKVNE
ncbi:hypothetical protein ACFL42_00635 [Candidatus Omnitrophota bacterium]